MKKIMAMLAMLMLVVPFANVKAITGNYFVYGVGDEVNFYYTDEKVEDKDLTTIILSDEGANSQYVKVFGIGVDKLEGAQGYADEPAIDAGALTDFSKTLVYQPLLAGLNMMYEGLPAAKPLEEAGNLSLITLDELKTIFGATLDGNRYVIDAAKWGYLFENRKSNQNGMYTQTVEGTDVWIVKWVKDAENKVVEIYVEKENVESSVNWQIIPVVYMDKTYDCTDRSLKKDYACYSCGEDYTWTEVGSQADTCTLVEKVKAKADCVKGPKTGVEDYILPFIAIIAVGGIALTIVSKKDLFRGI